MNILIVDDDADVRAYLRQLLSDEGHVVREAVNGQDGLASALERKPDAIISDGLMPVMDGFQLLQALKKNPELASIPFILFSSIYTGEREQNLARSLGAVAFLVKPQSPDVIIRTIRDATAGRKTAGRGKPALIGDDTVFAQEYSRIVATALEEKVGELSAASNEWRATFDAMIEAVALLDADGRIMRCNKAMALLAKRPFTEIIGAACDELCGCFGGNRDECPFIKSKTTLKRETVVFKQNEQWFEASADPILDEAGAMRGAVHILQDITGRKLLEDTLRDSEEKFRNFFELANDAVFIVDMTGKFIDVNRTAYERLGYTKGEMLGKRVSEIDPPEFAAKVPERLVQITKFGKAVFESAHRKKDGAVMPVEINARVIDYEGRKVFLSVVRDITERKKADAILRKRELQLAESQRIAGIGSWERNLITNEVTWSDELFRILGLDPEKVQADFETLQSLILPEDREGQRLTVAEAIEKRKPYNVEYRILKPDGSQALLHAQGEVVCDDSGKPAFIRGTAQDITERRRAEDLINEIVRQQMAILSNIPDIAWLKDKAGRFLAANEAFGRVCGISPLDLVGKTDRDVWPRELAEQYLADDREVMRSGKRKVREEQLADKEGKLSWIETIKTPIYGEKGFVIGTTGIARDITERKRAEDETKKTNALLEAINRVQTQFIVESNPSVVFDNILNSILSLTQSKYGFVGEILHSPEGDPYIKSHAITNIAWNDPTKALYEQHAPNLEFFNLKTLFGSVLVTGKPVIANDPAGDPRRGGLPQGHPRMDNFLGLPFSYGNTLVGMIGIANRPQGYDEKVVEYLQPLLNLCGNIIESYRNEERRKKAEQSLQESEERYRSVVENAFDMIQSIAPDGRFLYVNPAWSRVMGYSLEDLRDRTIFDIIHPACQTKCSTVFSRVSTGASIDHFETQFVSKDGRVVEIEGSATSRTVNGAVVSMQCLLHDVTERKKLDEQVFRVKQDWEYTFNSITDMVTVHDADYNIILANKAAQKILHLPVLEKMKEKKCFAYYHGTDHAPEGCPSCGCLQTGVSATFEVFEPHLNMFIEIRAIPRFDSNGSLIGLIHVVRDITERKKNEEAIATHSRELTALNTASNTLMLITNLRDIYQEICNIIYSVFSLKMVWLGIIEEGAFDVKPIAHCGQEDGYLSTIRVTWDDTPFGRGPTGMALKTHTIYKSSPEDPMFAPWSSEARKRGYLASMSVPLLYARDKCVGVLNFYSDKTDYFTPDRVNLCQVFANQAAIAIENARLVEELEEKVQERTRALEGTNMELQVVNKELVLRREEADAASRSKTDFLANMSHELRTPLNAIMGFSEIMLMGMAGPISDKQQEFLNDISKSGNHLLSLINDILDLSKVEAGKMELEPEPVIIGELISGSLMMFKEKALKHSIRMETTIDPAIPQIVADRRKLKQVVVNLLSNAVKFTPDGGSVRVTARRVSGSELRVSSSELQVSSSGFGVSGLNAKRETQNTKHDPSELATQSAQLDADFLEISVVDTGVGISPEHQLKLFQAFQQIDSSLTRKHAGTGLGLSLCRRFVELHGGRIWVESEPGKGSAFRFVVPVRQA